MMDKRESGIWVLLALAYALFVSVLFWHWAESSCQTQYNVADCEWARSPFQPVEQEDEE